MAELKLYEDWYVREADGTIRPATCNEDLKQPRENRIITQEHIEQGGNKYFVSTVFLGLDHSFAGSVPILFETMVFPEENSQDLWAMRAATEVEARANHEQARQWVLSGAKEEEA